MSERPGPDRFDRFTRLAAALFDVPVALVTLVDAQGVSRTSGVGLEHGDLDPAGALCAHAVSADGPVVVPDLAVHEHLAAHPLVTGPPGLRFFAGHPLREPGGRALGALCVAGERPGRAGASPLAALGDLAALVEHELAGIGRAALRTVMQSVAESIVAFGDDGRILTANRAALEMFGAGDRGLVGLSVADLLAGLSWEQIRERLAEDRAADGEPVFGVRRLLRGDRPDGTTFPLELVISVTQLGGRTVFIAIGQDVTDREAARAALRASERRFREIFDGAAVGIVAVDLDGRITTVNAAFGEMLGFSVDELRGTRPTTITHPDDLEEDARLARLLLDGERTRYHREKRFLRRDGSAMWASVTASLLRDGDGRAEVALGVIEDITDRKEVERLKDEFVSVVGHELRTPLTSIRGSLGLLAGGLAGELAPEAREMVDLAITNTDRLVRLVTDTLEMERLDAGVVELEPAPVAAAALVEQATYAVAALAEQAGVELRSQVADVEVVADADRIVQALVNLLGNAVKFSPRGSCVTTTVAAQRDEALVSVADQGRGIPADQLERIFERFGQVDASDARDRGGTGLGLTITRAIVERHGGRLWAESAPGEGATLRFTIPLLPAKRAVAVFERRDAGRRRLAALVTALGYRTIAVGTAAEVVAAAQREPLAAIVSMLTPAVAEAARTLRSDPASAAVPFVVIGAGPPTDEEVAGVSAWLEEPQDDEALVGALERAVPALRPDRVLVVEDDVDLGRILCAGLARHGIDAQLARTGREAMEAIDRIAPQLVVLDLTLPGEDGFAVADWLRRSGRLEGAPLVVYTGRELDRGDRERLQLGATEFHAKGAVPPEVLQARVAELLAAVVDDGAG